MPLEKWSNEKWIEVFDRWLERTARYESALRKISVEHIDRGLLNRHVLMGSGAARAIAAAALIARKALEDE